MQLLQFHILAQKYIHSESADSHYDIIAGLLVLGDHIVWTDGTVDSIGVSPWYDDVNWTLQEILYQCI